MALREHPGGDRLPRRAALRASPYPRAIAAPGLAYDVTPTATAQWRAVGDALAAAFFDDPVFSFILPDPAKRPAQLRTFFGCYARLVALPHGHSVIGTTGDRVLGAMLVDPPGHWRAPVRAQLAMAPEMARGFGRRAVVGLRVLAGIERRHPREPHYYLPFIGVAPDGQGHGIGGALLTRLAERCDAEGLPAYLEASSPRNAALYARHGFVSGETIRPAGCPPLELMTRPPR